MKKRFKRIAQLNSKKFINLKRLGLNDEVVSSQYLVLPGNSGSSALRGYKEYNVRSYSRVPARTILANAGSKAQSLWEKPITVQLTHRHRRWKGLRFYLPPLLKSGELLSRKQLAKRRFFTKAHSVLKAGFLKKHIINPKSRLLDSPLSLYRRLSLIPHSVFSDLIRKLFRSRKTLLPVARAAIRRRLSLRLVRQNLGVISQLRKGGEGIATALHSMKSGSCVTLSPFMLTQANLNRYLKNRYAGWSKPVDTDLTKLHKHFLDKTSQYLELSYEVSLLTKTQWNAQWSTLVTMYAFFARQPFYDLYAHFKDTPKSIVLHNLYLTFNKHRMSVSLTDSREGITHFTITVGVLMRYFQNRKALRKHKALRVILARVLRKMLMVLRLKAIHLRLRGLPLHLDLFMKTLFEPLNRPFTDPLSGVEIDETKSKQPRLIFNWYGLEILRPKPYGYQKVRKKGRVKRKIRRKLVKLVKLID